MATDSSPTVLVIDDEIGPRESLRFLLKPDYQVLCAEGVDRGLELLRAHTPDAVILDIRMPGRNGIEGLREIRRIDPDTAVIMLTGYAALGSAQEAVRNAANDYIEKPFDAGEMRRTVHWHVTRTRLRRQRAQLAREMEQMQKRLAAEFLQKDLLAELGQASTEFVHDLRNALAIAGGSAAVLRLELGGDGHGRRAAAEPSLADEYLDMMERTLLQCREMLDSWGRLIKQEPSEIRVFSLATLVQEAVIACQPAADTARARLLCEVGTDDLEVLGDAAQLERAICNILHNAFQALPPAEGWVRVSAECQGEQAQIRVTDNGCGIPAENLAQLFKPHFTTKQARGGMGLGLFIAHRAVTVHHGTLVAASTPGQGTTMTITLPLHRPGAATTGVVPAA
jgi:signal transduction histidine kinase